MMFLIICQIESCSSDVKLPEKGEIVPDYIDEVNMESYA